VKPVTEPSQTPLQRSAEQCAEGESRYRDFLAYVRKTFHVGTLLEGVVDTRKKSKVPTVLVMRILFLVGLLRIPSFNALEPKLAKAGTQRALGFGRVKQRRVCSADTLGYALKRIVMRTVRAAVVAVIKKAERNKVFREGWYGALRFVAIDGWEPISSFSRHCDHCLVRLVRKKLHTGEVEEVEQYYHRYVVAMLVDEHLDVVLDMEEIRSADARKESGESDVKGHEGELTAAKRLVVRLRRTYGRWLDVLLVDGLYANGPFLTLATKENHFGVIAVLKKSTDEPLKEALALWEGKPAEQVLDDEDKGERVELWDCPPLETLSSYKGGIRVVRGLVHKHSQGTSHNWCFGVTGKANRLRAAQVTAAGRGRWHVENTAFGQWTLQWHFGHVFVHHAKALFALLWIFVWECWDTS